MSLTVRHLHQMVGNVVTNSFAHQTRHPTQNTLVPILGLSGVQSLMMIVMYDCKKDVLCYIQPYKWFNSYAVKFNEEGLVMIWLCLYHSLFLKSLSTEEVQTGLHDRFNRDQLLEHYRSLSDINVDFWPPMAFESFARRKRRRGVD